MFTLTTLGIDGWKKCSSCGEQKAYGGPLSEYNRDKTHGDGYKSSCRDCRHAASASARIKQLEQERRLTKEQQERQAMLDEKAQAHRDAILRLINAHREEFESYVNAALMKMGSKHTSVRPVQTWIAAG